MESPLPTFAVVGAQQHPEDDSGSQKSIITSLAAVIAIMSVVIVSLLFYAFCFKSPMTGGKTEPKRSITIEPASEISARRPTLLSDTHKTIAEEARDASVKQKIRRNNSMKVQKEKKKEEDDKKTEEGTQKDDVRVVEEKIGVGSDTHETEKAKASVIETKVQVHAEDIPDPDKDKPEDTQNLTTLESITMPILVVEQSPEMDSTEPNFVQTPVTPDQTTDQLSQDLTPDHKTLEEVKINVEVSDDEASNIHLGNAHCTDTITKSEGANEPEETKLVSRIPVPLHSSVNRSDSADSVKSKTSNKSRKSDCGNTIDTR